MVTMIFKLIPLLLMNVAGPNLLVNPGFDKGLDGWVKTSDRITIEPVRIGGRTAVHIVVPEGTAAGHDSLYQEVEVKPGDRITITGEGMRRNVIDGEGAYMELAFINRRGRNVFGVPSDHVIADNRWTSLAMPLHLLRPVPEGCVKARVSLIFRGHGEAYFDNLSLVRLKAPAAEPAGPVTLEATQNVICDSLIGFGAEDDGWFYFEKNMEHGVTLEDLALRESRIAWLNPAWVRSFLWIMEWCPSGDLKTFTFESPGMKSHYRTFDLYQKIGASINVTDTEWNLPGIYSKPEQVAPAIGQLMEYLIKTKGYTCIKYWTLTNEPDLDFTWRGGYPFENYVRIYQLVREEFKKRGLNVKIIGSDDANSLSYFETCIKDDRLYDAVDLFSSHTYPRASFLDTVPVFFDSRMALVNSRQPRKPFVIGELGFSGEGFGSHENPLMKTYDYALYASQFVIDGLNRGVAGFSIWAVQESYYPSGDKMEPGLWDFKDNGWKPRPVYHAWGAFSRLARAGDKVRQVKSSSPERVLGAVVGKTLFWINRGSAQAEVIVRGLDAKEARIMEEKTLQGDRECGVVLPLKDGRFTAPARSFGYAR